MNFLDTSFVFFKKLNTSFYLIGLCVLAIIIRAAGIDLVNLSIEEIEFLYYSHPSTTLEELFQICKNGLQIFDFALYRFWFTLVGFSILKAKCLAFFLIFCSFLSAISYQKKLVKRSQNQDFSPF